MWDSVYIYYYPSSTSNSANTDKPVLLAAYMGNHEVLRVLKTRIKGKERVRFDVWSNHNRRTVLHLVLRKIQVSPGIWAPQRINEEDDK